ncbi:MAG: hypothetical protein ACUVWR_10920 [Anaerolineae bacterium]
MRRLCGLLLVLSLALFIFLPIRAAAGTDLTSPSLSRFGKGEQPPLLHVGEELEVRSLHPPQDATAATDDPSAIAVTQLHIFFIRAGDSLQVAENYIISNDGNSTYVGKPEPGGDKNVTLSFTLPTGASNLRFEGPGLGERFLQRPDGFVDTQPVPPGTGTADIRFSYELPYEEGQQIQRTFSLPVMSVVLLLVGEDMSLTAEGLAGPESIDTQMGPALYYTAGPLAPGQPLVFAITGVAVPVVSAKPTAAFSEPSRNAGIEVGVGLVAFLAALAVAYLLWRPAAGSLPMPTAVRPLVSAIAALDADFENGRLPQEPYRRKRASLKRQVVAECKRQGIGGKNQNTGKRK